MRLTSFCDYSLRVLIYLGLKREKASIAEISGAYGISRNHLVKVAHALAKLGYVQSFQGKGGGIALASEPGRINIADVVERVEPDFDLVECFSAGGACCIEPACKLRRYFAEANRAFLDSLRKYTLADILQTRDLAPLLKQAPPS